MIAGSSGSCVGVHHGGVRTRAWNFVFVATALLGTACGAGSGQGNLTASDLPTALNLQTAASHPSSTLFLPVSGCTSSSVVFFTEHGRRARAFPLFGSRVPPEVMSYVTSCGNASITRRAYTVLVRSPVWERRSALGFNNVATEMTIEAGPSTIYGVIWRKDTSTGVVVVQGPTGDTHLSMNLAVALAQQVSSD